MRIISQVLWGIILLNTTIVTAQAWEPEKLNYCFKGERFSIATICEDCQNYECGFFVVNNESPGNEFFYIHDYEFFYDDMSMLDVILVKQENENYNPHRPNSYKYKTGVINLITGKIIVPIDDQLIRYNKKDELFVVNNDTKGALIDKNGKRLELKSDYNLGFGELGYFYSHWELKQAIIFDKNEKEVLNLGEYYLFYTVGDDTFVLYDDESGIKITNKKGDELYKYKCSYAGDYAYETHYNNSSWFYVASGCGYDDDVYTLFQDKKGRWVDPIFKFNTENYISYAAKLSEKYKIEEFEKEEVALYVVSEDKNDEYKEKGYLLTINGDIVHKLEDAPRMVHFEIDANFIYVYTDNRSRQCLVYNLSGEKITQHEGNLILSLKDQIGTTEYAAFVNPSRNETYVIHTPTKKLITVEETIFRFKSLNDVKAYFNKN